MTNLPKVLILNYDENGDYAKNHIQSKNDIMAKINDDGGTSWDLIILCTQKSLSNLVSVSSYMHADTMQHVIGEEMKKNNQLNNTYKLFSKIDATIPANSKKIIFNKDKKFRNVRVRCWINVNVLIPKDINTKFLKSTSYKSNNNSFENYYVTDNHNNSQINDKIKLVKYQYKRLTQSDITKRQEGEGAIIVSFILKKGTEKYQYVVCNYDSKLIKEYLNQEYEYYEPLIREYFKKLVNKDNKEHRQVKNKIVNLEPTTKKINIDNLFLSYLSCNSIVYKKLQINDDASFYNCFWNNKMSINNIKNYNLSLEQITDRDISQSVSEPEPLYQPLSQKKVHPENNNISQQNKNIVSKYDDLTKVIKKVLFYYYVILKQKSNQLKNINKDIVNFYLKILIKKKEFKDIKCFDNKPLSYENILNDLKYIILFYKQKGGDNKELEKIKKYYKVWEEIDNTFLFKKKQNYIENLYAKLV
jgi:hypothetical protein